MNDHGVGTSRCGQDRVRQSVFIAFCAALLWLLPARPTCAEALGGVSDPPMAKARVHLGGRVFDVEMARTPQQQAQGLMGRTRLDEGNGMVFPFPSPQTTAFWMKQCRIPLDILFYRSGKLVRIVRDAPPCEADPCPLYRSILPVDGALELPGGTATRLGLKLGDTLILDEQSDDGKAEEAMPPPEPAPDWPDTPLVLPPSLDVSP